MKKIALLPNTDKDPDFSYSAKISDYLMSRGAEVYTIPVYSSIAPNGVKILPVEEIYGSVDCVITLGGDGTLLRVARQASMAQKPILGINFGKIGYMAELEYNEIHMLKALFDENYTIEQRLMLDVTVTRTGETVFESVALNDAVVSKGIIARLIDLDVSSNGSPISKYRADGIILSTPTGSTGYSMSAGGPILEPSSQALILTPVSPHSLAARSIVFSDNSVISVTVSNLIEKDAYLTIDGFEMLRLEDGDTVNVRRSKRVTRLIKIKNVNFYKILNSKLIDGERMK